MSSEERDVLDSIAVPAKKRRIQRACDACRQKRRACDGLRTSTKKCSYCMDNRMECVYSGAPPTTQRPSYTQVLQERLATAEKLIRKAGQSIVAVAHSLILGVCESSKHSPSINHKSVSSSVSDASESLSPAVELAAMSIRALADRDDEDELVQTMEDLSLRPHGKDFFLGKSSGAMLFHKAHELKDEYYMAEASESEHQVSRRPEFWTARPWQPRTPTRPRYTFPPADLLSSLVELYFAYSAIYTPPPPPPLLPSRTFRQPAPSGRQIRRHRALCMRDRFAFFNQVGAGAQMNGIFESPKLFDIQRICLSIQFVEGSAQQGAWTLVGIGIRMAQEMGAHRRQLRQPHTLEAELWRRAFWVLVAYDRGLSTGMGRPCATHYYDFDIQMPTECDDEYCEHEDPAQAFRQPPGAPPSRVAFFNAYLRLSNILAFVLHLLYSSPKSTNLAAAGDRGWDEQIVKELDSALNKWVDGIPEHLRWDPRRADPVFFNQSVALYTAFYLVQMTAHRLFIPMVRKTPTTLPSLAICTNAARSCSHVVDVWYQRMRHAPAVILLPALTTASLMLLLNVWSGRRTGLAPHMNTAIAEVHKCMRVVKLFETRWQAAGIFWDMLNELASVGQVPLAASTPVAEPAATTTPNQRKRAHPGHDDDDAPPAQELETTFESADPLGLPIGFEDTSFQWLGALDAVDGMLPMSGEDLGRLPLFPPPPDYTFHAPVPPQGVEYPDWTKLSMPAFYPSSSSAASSATAVTQDGMSAEDVFSMIDNDVMAMWSNAPTSLGAGDWSNYFDIMDSLNRETLL
ncbi:Zn(2)-C6 fungal-type domain-containing protein [Mycena sanguinolenta]|uniref:Zn(2)-C6 fungal-type domain-containing protein n=1 Tax=Mycena sanguinolenta TaxID=230812 RepID=A0A8H6Y403_9AGAR|nr:Zn(2)-C6 fungal-type domain-containing protein [Mycena sanguinolenta]